MFRAAMSPSSGDTTLSDTWYLFFCMYGCLVCRVPVDGPIIRRYSCVFATRGTCFLYGWLVFRVPVEPLYTRQSSIQKNNYQVSHKHSCICWWWVHSSPKHVEIDKYKYLYTKKKNVRRVNLLTRLNGVRIWIIIVLFVRTEAWHKGAVNQWKKNITRSLTVICTYICHMTDKLSNK